MRLAIDTDPGIDDALALLFAFGAPDVRVEAITTVAGNVPLDTATANVLRLLALRPPRPRPMVAAGASAPLRRPLRTAVAYHGADGLGDAEGWPVVDASSVPANGVEVLTETAQRHGAELTLVALGPLTNLALALARDHAALRGVGRVVVMGGAVDVPGNITPAAEFNFHVDPDAAAAVLDAGRVVDLVPLDATRQAVLPRAHLHAAVLRCADPVGSRIAAFTEHGFRVDARRGSPGMVLHDPLAMGAAVVHPVVEWEPVRLVVGPDGATRRGSGAPNCRIPRRVDAARFLQLFLAWLLPPAGTVEP